MFAVQEAQKVPSKGWRGHLAAVIKKDENQVSAPWQEKNEQVAICLL